MCPLQQYANLNNMKPLYRNIVFEQIIEDQRRRRRTFEKEIKVMKLIHTFNPLI